MIKPVIVVCIFGAVIGFIGGRAVNNDESRRQREKTVVIQYQLVAPHENVASLVRGVEVIVTGEVVSTQSFLEESGSPYSVHEFRVEHCLKGDVENSAELIRVRQWTGPVPANIDVADLEYVGSLLEEGERYVVFLSKMRTVSDSTPELHPGDYALVDSDSAIALRDGQALPLQDWTPIAQMLETQQVSEEELIAVVSQAAEEAAPGTEQ